MDIGTHALVQSYLFCESKDVKSSRCQTPQRLRGQVLPARRACAPGRLFSRRKTGCAQVDKGCGHWVDKGDRRCRLFPGTEAMGTAGGAGAVLGWALLTACRAFRRSAGRPGEMSLPLRSPGTRWLSWESAHRKGALSAVWALPFEELCRCLSWAAWFGGQFWGVLWVGVWLFY